MDNSQNKKVSLVEETFGIKLPTLKMYQPNVVVKTEPSESGGVNYAGKWNYKSQPTIPIELEQLLPKNNMTAQQAVNQLGECSYIARGAVNDSYKIYRQSVMMQFMQNAILNCIYIASKDFDKWLNKPINLSYDTFIYELVHQIGIFNQTFTKQRPLSYSYEDYINRSLLRLILENNFTMKPEYIGLLSQNGNTLFQLLFYNFLIKTDEGGLQNYVRNMLQKQCEEVALELKKIK